ncbi:AP endonuclease, family 2 OS=Caldanaerobacter subterraneus subsp. pacificus DSM 12653 GN=CDSM653_704 PE=4 SV=1: AP_endonuc_2 [Gemmataceae bacterium]|nr:AP endonuclease, family 2 OS=Caldanaerobacter subterraneus subsp. pacificus DSM 12653 GN=CDSM653_704 PE=4 SV=1: AP_endonuc_2 [Gemmataceae bacterium]VTT97860.1 AP endonuclease, family 2 OS=Caldanaerobacter subterraneus subsp. pacificus DSM 12653 GN=CDSM653_704 PE=4 SV=1: AP_endonuc_2 [Gemmataceae bacterium]
MKPLKIGIVVESTELPFREAITRAARMASECVQVDAVGDLSPDALGETGRRGVRNLLTSFSQTLAALNVPLRRGFDVAESMQQRLDHVRKVMQLAIDLGSTRVVVPCPKLPTDAASPRAATLKESLQVLAGFADRIGAVLALEIGFDPAEKVAEYLGRFDTAALKVTYDPANMLLHGHDPLASLHPLKEHLTHLHARDARSASLSRGLQEVPLGAGDIDWMAFTATLQVLEFDGAVVVEREQGESKLADVASGVKFLRRFALPAM